MDCPRCGKTGALSLVIRPTGMTDIECLRRGCNYAIRHDLEKRGTHEFTSAPSDLQDYIRVLLWVFEVSPCTNWHHLFVNLGLAKWLHNRGIYSHSQVLRLEQLKSEYFEDLNGQRYLLGDALHIGLQTQAHIPKAWSELIDLINVTEPFDIKLGDLILEKSTDTKISLRTELYRRILSRQTRTPPYNDAKAMDLALMLIRSTSKSERNVPAIYREMSKHFDLDVPNGVKLFHRLNNLLAALSYGPGETFEQLWTSVSDSDS